MKKFSFLSMALFASILFTSGISNAATIEFNTVVSGVTSFSFDGDGDFIGDVIFSTTDPSGFNTIGPGPDCVKTQSISFCHYYFRLDNVLALLA